MEPQVGRKAKEYFSIKSQTLREFLAEFLGVFLLIMFGDGAVAQSVLSGKANGEFLSINWGYGIGVMMGVLVSGGISGGHINPAVTLAMSIWGKLPWKKVPIYMLAQYLGAFVASAVLFGVYRNALDVYDGERTMATAGIWATYPGLIGTTNSTELRQYLTNGNSIGDQVVGTMILLICVCAIVDKRNMNVPSSLIPLMVGLCVIGLGTSYGLNCGYAINPARDLAPRLFTYLTGWEEAFSYSTIDGIAYWWVPVLGPHIGAILGVTIYSFFVEIHHQKEEEEDIKNEEVVCVMSDPMTSDDTKLMAEVYHSKEKRF